MSVPAEWRLGTLGDVCSFENGDRGSNYPAPEAFVPEGVPFVNAGHLRDGLVRFDSMDYITEDAYLRLGAGKYVAGDILFCLRGSLGKFGVVREEDRLGGIASSLVIVRPKKGRVLSKYLAAYFDSELCALEIERWAGGAAQPNLGAKDLARFTIPLPPMIEQERVAAAVQAVDALVQAIEQSTAKKQSVEQGMRQELLTGRTRLPGFSGEWVSDTLGAVSRIKTGSRNNQDKDSSGTYPFFVRSATVERIGTYSYDTEAILVPGEGGIGSIFHYIDGKFEVHQRVYKISDFSPGISGKFIYYYMRQFFGEHAMENSVKATVDSLRLPTFKSFELRLPPTGAEQAAIVEVLENADAEIRALERRLEITRAIKQGMMQELLTGRTRLAPAEALV